MWAWRGRPATHVAHSAVHCALAVVTWQSSSQVWASRASTAAESYDSRSGSRIFSKRLSSGTTFLLVRSTGIPTSSCSACLYPEHWIGGRVAQILARHDVPIETAKDNRNRVSIRRVAVRFLSMHNPKGLEFPCVAIAGLGLLGRHGETIEECVRLRMLE